MSRRISGRWQLLALVLVAAAAAAVPAVAGDPLLVDAAGACLLAGPAAAASLTVAAGRPCLALAAFAASGGYITGLLTTHGHGTLASLALSVLCVAAIGGLLGLAGARLGSSAFLGLGLIAAIGGGALVDALPEHTGAESGLGPLPPLGIGLPDGSQLTLGAAGAYHAALMVAAVVTLLAMLLHAGAPGRRWRATGGDRERALGAGLHPLVAEASALAAAGAIAGLCGGLAALVAGVVTPSGFAPEAAVVPLAAALLAGRSGPVIAALIAVAEGITAVVMLPRAGYTGPPSAQAAAAAGLALVAVVALLGLPALRRRGAGLITAGAPSAARQPWPDLTPAAGPRALAVEALVVRAPGGPLLVPGLTLEVPAGTVHGLVGANGSGKSSSLRSVMLAWRGGSARVRLVPELRDARAGVPVVLLPQHGGGWPGCTVRETLVLAARAGGRRHRSVAGQAADAWLDRLGLRELAGTPCELLAAGARRRLELGRCLLLRPAVLLCDEPLAGLDGDDRALVVEGLRAAAAAGVAVVLSEHDRATVISLASAVTELSHARGQSVAGAPSPAPGTA